MAKMDLPPEFVFEHKGKQRPSAYAVSSSSGSDAEPDDASRGDSSPSTDPDKSLKRKHKVVTFANEPPLPQREYSDEEDEIDEEEQQRFMKMRYKRTASLPSIELNRELAKKIRRMLNDDDQNQDDLLHQQLTGMKLSREIEKSLQSELKYEYEFLHGQVLQVRLGDITDESADIIVNESNGNLHHTSGVASVLAQKGGKEIQIQSDHWVRKHGPIPPGQVAVTEAGHLPCKWLIHAVGPIWRGGNSREDTELWDAMWNCLVWASKLHARTIAIPALGATFLGFQKERCAYLLVDCIAKFFQKHPKSKVQEIRIVNHNEAVTDAVVFEVVGKFTSGCETSDSEHDASDYEDEDEEEEDLDREEEYEESDADDQGDQEKQLPIAGSVPPSQIAATAVTGMPAKWLRTWRRQSVV